MRRFLLALPLACAAALSGCELDAVSPPIGPVGRSLAAQETAAQDAGSEVQTAADAQAPTPANPTQAQAAAQSLVVHEWGTFTSMQTSAGVTLEGMHHEDEALPGFVHARDIKPKNQKGIEILPEAVTQKMETPVLYFHTAVARKIKVRVDFPQGVISQWYPDVTAFAPAKNTLTKLAGGSVTWDVQLDPKLDPALSPVVAPDDIWAPSRKVAATMLSYGKQVERFLFYRGLGRFELPVRVTSDVAGMVTVRNDGKEDLPAAFLLLTTASGGRVVALGPIAAGQSVKAQVPEALPGIAALVQSAGQALHSALVATGLFADEARSMVDTWSKSYFQTPGLRVLYVLPAAWTDALLPLQVTPAPTATVRVLVGRIEVLTPAIEQQIVAAVQASLDKGNAQPVTDLGRFLEPKLLRAAQLVTTPKLQAHCKDLLQWAASQP